MSIFHTLWICHGFTKLYLCCSFIIIISVYLFKNFMSLIYFYYFVFLYLRFCIPLFFFCPLDTVGMDFFVLWFNLFSWNWISIVFHLVYTNNRQYLIYNPIFQINIYTISSAILIHCYCNTQSISYLYIIVSTRNDTNYEINGRACLIIDHISLCSLIKVPYN